VLKGTKHVDGRIFDVLFSTFNFFSIFFSSKSLFQATATLHLIYGKSIAMRFAVLFALLGAASNAEAFAMRPSTSFRGGR
jgi:hypothetical protein